MACKRLAIIGDAEAVPALAALLPECGTFLLGADCPGGDSRHGGRRCPAGGAGKLQGRLRWAQINSLGVRRDAKAVDGLIARLKDSDGAVAAAAAVALGRIGGEAAMSDAAEFAGDRAQGSPLGGGRRMHPLRRARPWPKATGRRRSSSIDEVRAADLPQTRVLEATRGAILARGAEGVPLLVKELQSADKGHFALGLRVARELPGPEATEAMAAELARAVPQRQSLLILALADRGEASVVPQIVKAAKSSPTGVRVYALRALKKVDESVSRPCCWKRRWKTNAVISQAAQGVIDGQQGAAIDGLIAERLPGAKGPARKVLIELAGRRHVAAATATLVESRRRCGRGGSPAALTALGGTIQFAELPQLIARLRTVPDGRRCGRHCQGLAAGLAADARPGSAAPRSWPRPWRAPPWNRSANCWTCSARWVARRRWPPLPTLPGRATKRFATRPSACLGQWMSVDAAPLLLADLAKRCQGPEVPGAGRAGLHPPGPAVRHAAGRPRGHVSHGLGDCPTARRQALVLEILLRYPSPEMLDLALEAAKMPELKDEAADRGDGDRRAARAATPSTFARPWPRQATRP